MIAARIHAWRGPVFVEDIPSPCAAPGRSLVQISAAAVGHLDTTIIDGALGDVAALPHVPGVEAAGVVLDSDHLPVGSKVVVRGAGVGISESGCWASIVSAPNASLHEWPDGMSAELAATYFVPATTAHVALHEVGQLASDETVFVTGAAGAVGALVCQLALAAGANVIAVTSRPDALKTLDVQTIAPSALDEQREALRASGCSFMIDTVGGQELAERASWIASGGRVALIGYTRGQEVTLHLPTWLMADVRFLPVNTIAKAWAADAAAPELARRLIDGSLTLPVETGNLNEVPALLDRLRSGAIQGRAAVSP